MFSIIEKKLAEGVDPIQLAADMHKCDVDDFLRKAAEAEKTKPETAESYISAYKQTVEEGVRIFIPYFCRSALEDALAKNVSPATNVEAGFVSGQLKQSVQPKVKPRTIKRRYGVSRRH